MSMWRPLFRKNMILDHKLQRMLNDSKIAQLNSERPLHQTAVCWLFAFFLTIQKRLSWTTTKSRSEGQFAKYVVVTVSKTSCPKQPFLQKIDKQRIAKKVSRRTICTLLIWTKSLQKGTVGHLKDKIFWNNSAVIVKMLTLCLWGFKEQLTNHSCVVNLFHGDV